MTGQEEFAGAVGGDGEDGQVAARRPRHIGGGFAALGFEHVVDQAHRDARQGDDDQRHQHADAQPQPGHRIVAAEQRGIEEQTRQLNARREKLSADKNALAAPDEQRLLNAR